MRLRVNENESDIGSAAAVGSTAITVILCNGKIYTANLGDSRAVMAVDSGRRVDPDN